MTVDIAAYVATLKQELSTGIAREHAYRAALETLLESVESGINAVNDPKGSEIGRPDFIIMRRNAPIAYVEAKDLPENLSDKKHKKQFERYLGALPNLIITNYHEFRWYVAGQHRKTVTIADFKAGKLTPRPQDYPALVQMLQGYLAEAYPHAGSDVELAKQLARKARLIADLVEDSIRQDDTDANPLVQQRDIFQQTLIPDLQAADFADLYAQTLTYGLFVARVNFTGTPGTFQRKGVAEDIPQTNPFLRKMFEIVLPEISSRLGWVIDDLVTMLAHAEMDTLLKDFGKKTRTEDPVLHFYETFLQAYNPQLRETRGVYYTPEPVVQAIVRLVDDLLIRTFDRPDGLNDKHTLILDPATGTGTFLYRIIQHIYETNGYNAGQKGAWPTHVQKNLLPRLFGFELLVAPYTVAHTKIGVLLKETGYVFSPDQRLNIYLTNTLENPAPNNLNLPFADNIKRESVQAAQVKNEKPIMVIVGNPPYSGHSANKGQWINEKIDDYFFVDEKRISEKNPKWIRNDYVKFLRFGQWRIHQTGSGIMAYIVDNGYLDNITFRGVRQQLLKAFSEIYIINLHGNSKKKETAPDGSRDENVFDIQQGVAISLFIKRPNTSGPAVVKSVDIWGGRKDKHEALNAVTLDELDWQTLTPQSPNYFFVPQETALRDEYEQGWKITDIFPTNVLGFQTHRDHFAIDFEREGIEQRISDLRNTTLTDEELKHKYDLRDNRDWNVAEARIAVRGLDDPAKPLIPVAYRPFDTRYTYFSGVTMDYPRRELLRHVAHQDNLVLNVVRQTKASVWQHGLVSDKPSPALFVEIKDGSTSFPLYLYPTSKDMFEPRKPNLKAEFIEALAACVGMAFHVGAQSPAPSDQAPFTPEDVFHYIYATLHDPVYRRTYAPFLKQDFPRIPLPQDAAHFRRLVSFGERLVKAHLLKDISGRDLITAYPTGGSNTIEKGYPRYTPPSASGPGRVQINDTQAFEGLAPEVWSMLIGGYQVLEKWLKDRQGRSLSDEDILHYQKIVVALTRTQAIMHEIESGT